MVEKEKSDSSAGRGEGGANISGTIGESDSSTDRAEKEAYGLPRWRRRCQFLQGNREGKEINYSMSREEGWMWLPRGSNGEDVEGRRRKGKWNKEKKEEHDPARRSRSSM